ncbi:UDP-N-acetylglucosamine 1-carboxyvinyltransferase [Frankia casuarinae]|uniref:UDP-N-acetylglucosamine 1-carboxyvinyltransferase n=1 Tax=Frankia casuarinae (strain DSM 45818 / CECT 9043 / HFP020203 / CcI3) TaxID=106370 RepID=Q2J6X7_FRACC|nr:MULTISPECIES: UDP-N-acetylglucosamine 1-carboxyvinyltransferase [Frankia]ABD12965.1 UDP-N-acetylglucosamine 1-carboxyvinyltransferase [Frankia casuarinae]ETA03570.1 UDP-N-acetylglucosamine 1-carboxyvinyltransferase [Frankia sp. CcI6]EYT93479.1 UDP-N-acetylglucosamine 1-carboxyvinyltransferase [Frankia casuarinae]KDA43758.1 UDP-N-acetylglucosamine 1-carboxyvinyltransferase [Frankia sp. BMG5.23]KEZ36153.1 UDP-N-acetylglucosamine 1-carboxyvinyltransferase [Frankia sp. CeD]
MGAHSSGVVPSTSTDRRWYRIVGGAPLTGSVEASGAKNSVTKLLVATLLTPEPCTLTRVPRIAEVDVVLGMLAELGTQVEWLDEHTVRLATEKIIDASLSEAYSGVNRIPILMMGPLLHRVGEAVIPLPGGCRIGKRPVDFHLAGLRAMGAEIVEQLRSVQVKTLGLHGTHVALPFPSVGATENLLLAAVRAQGTTVISNAAVEPEVIDLIMFLQQMGALVDVEVDRTIVVQGVDALRGATHAPIHDRIEAASFASAAVATNGRVEVVGARQEHLATFLNHLRRLGGEFEVTPRGMTFFRAQPLTASHVQTDVHPGFMTDWQQPLVVLLTQAKGASVIHETIYEDRFGYTRQLAEMGADIALSTLCLGGKACRFASRDFEHSAVVSGPTSLTGGDLAIPDLRAGFAYVLAALVADGTSIIRGTRFLERGYEDPVGKLRSIGAFIDTQAVGSPPAPTTPRPDRNDGAAGPGACR